MEELYNGYGWRITLDSAALPDGRVKKAARVHRADGAHIIALPSENTVLLLREYRPFYGDFIWMLPSGHIDKEQNPEVGAQRELQEETGFKAGSLTYLWTTRSSEGIDYASHIFLARDLVLAPLPQDEDEVIEVHELLVDEALERVLGSKEVHTASAYALLRYIKERV